MLDNLIGKIIELYIDDNLVKSIKTKDRVKSLDAIFKILRYRMRLNLIKYAFDIVSKKFLGYMVNQRCNKVNPERIKVFIEMRSP